MAISTRGAHSWVRNTPTGLPDCTSIVSSSPSVRSVRQHRVEGVPRTRRPARAAVHDEVVGSLGHLGVEVVLQHPERRLLRPSAARSARVPRGARTGRAPCAHRLHLAHGAARLSRCHRVAEFAGRARDWLAEHRIEAPPDYGAICPPELIEAGVAWQRLLDAEGYAGIHWPVEYGGRGLTPEHQAAWLWPAPWPGCRRCSTWSASCSPAGPSCAHGTPGQQARHLRATLAAEHVWCQLFSEPGAGSDLASLSTRAERDGDRFVVNGQKVWCSGGRVSNWGILMARTDADAPKHEGISFFLCPMDTPGIEVRPLRQMTGGAEFDEVFLTDVELPADHLLGPLHGGWGVGMDVLTNERGHIGTAVISLQRRLDAVRRCSVRAGRSTRRAPAPGSARLDRHRLPVAGPAGGVDGDDRVLAPEAGITEMMFDVAIAAGRRRRTRGPARPAPTAPDLLAAPGGRIAGGTSQVQRNIIGERLLGLPREPRPADGDQASAVGEGGLGGGPDARR